MSLENVYEYKQGESQLIERWSQQPAGAVSEAVWIGDQNGVKMLGYDIQIWTAETGGTQLVETTDYNLAFLDAAATESEGFAINGGYEIINPAYANVTLYVTMSCVGGYTSRPYRPTYHAFNGNGTLTPTSVDDSAVVDTSGGIVTITVEDGERVNQRVAIVSAGGGETSLSGSGMEDLPTVKEEVVSFVWSGDKWLPLGGFGETYDEGPLEVRDWVSVWTGSATSVLNEWGEGLFYVGLEYEQGGDIYRTNGAFGILLDGVDRTAVLAVDTVGGTSTASISWDSGTNTFTALEQGGDFTNLSIVNIYHWETIFTQDWAWGETVENPAFGEKMEEGELFLDGTGSLASSDGREPVADTLDYIPAVGNVDGVEYTPAELKWSQRGTYGFFGEYTNVIDVNDRTDIDSTFSEEGGWYKTEATAVANAGPRFNFVSTDTGCYVECLIRRGQHDNVQVGVFEGGSNRGAIILEFDTKTFTLDFGAVDEGTVYLSDDIALVKISNSYVFTGGSAYVAARLVSSPPVGSFCYMKNMLTVTGIAYPVPYTTGTNQAPRLQYDFDWATSTEWTIEGWVNANDDGLAKRLLTVGDSSSNAYMRISINAGMEILLLTYTGTGSTITGPVLTGATWYHFKIAVSSSSAEMFINGVSAGSHATNIPVFADIAKVAYIGYNDQLTTQQLQGYASDLRIVPGIDTSDTHYLSGLPYYDPKKTYGKEAMWSVDHRGIISGESQRSGRIIFDEEINGQWVTKWDTGRMEIRSNPSSPSGGPNPETITLAMPFINSSYSITGTVTGTTLPRILVIAGITAYSFDGYRFDNTGAATTNAFKYVCVGRWK